MKFLAVLLIVAIAGQTLAKSLKKEDLEQIAKLLGNLKAGAGGRGAGGRGDGGKGDGGKSDESDEDSVGPWAGSGHEGPEDGPGPFGYSFEDIVSHHCGIDLKAIWESMESGIAPVDKAEFDTMVQAVRSGAADIRGDLESHSGALTALETALADPALTPADMITQHGDLLTNFLTTVGGTIVKGMCAKAAMLPIQVRMSLAGVSGFRTAAKCNKAGILIWTILDANDWDLMALGPALAGRLDDAGESLRSDVACMIRDVKEYSEYMDSLQTDELSGRGALLLVETMSGYLENLGEDAMNLMKVATVMGDALGYEEAAEKKKMVKNAKLTEVRKELATLIGALRNLNV